MQSNRTMYKYLPFIAALYVTFGQISYVLAYKMVSFSIFVLPAGVIVFPIIYTLSDVIAEVYGYARIRRLLWESAVCGFVFTMSITLLLHLSSPDGVIYEKALGNIWRIYFAIVVGFTAGSFVNVYLLSKWKIRARGRYFWFRSFISTSLGEALVTLVVDCIAFIGVMSVHKVGDVVLTIYLFKVIYAFCAAIPASFLVRYLKKHEHLDVYDFATNFNPFKLSLNENGDKKESAESPAG